MMEAVIFDWAGTTVDYGCFAPVQAFMDAFAHFGIPVTTEETRKPMGMLKIEHIRTMLKTERIGGLWKERYGRPFEDADVQAVYEQFEPKLLSILENYSSPKPYVRETVEQLRSMGLRIGSTTGYTDRMMEIVAPKAAEQGYAPDIWISPDSVGSKGRPWPYMIFRNLQELNVSSVRRAVKVGDTVSDIREGVNAGVWSVGVVEGSSELGLSMEEFEALPEKERAARMKKAEETFWQAGADFVIPNLSVLPDLVKMLG